MDVNTLRSHCSSQLPHVQPLRNPNGSGNWDRSSHREVGWTGCGQVLGVSNDGMGMIASSNEETNDTANLNCTVTLATL